MPRVGETYQLPPNVKGSPNTPILSAPYNDVLDDLAKDANDPRPVTAGGTGGQTAQDGITNLFSGGAYVKDDKFLIADGADTSKRFRFEVSGVATATTRTLTLPDADVKINKLGASVTGADDAAKANDVLTTFSTDIASNTTTDLGTATGVNVMITGSNNITSFGSAPAGAHRLLIFVGALKITNNALSLVLPNAVDIMTMPGDMALMLSFFPGRWRCIHYQRASTIAFAADKNGNSQSLANGVVTFTTERFDVGDYYDIATNTYKPPAGRYRLSARVDVSGNLTAGVVYILNIRRNGVAIAFDKVIAGSAAGSFSLAVTTITDCNGITDTFDVFYTSGAGTQTISGSSAGTRFEGEEI